MAKAGKRVLNRLSARTVATIKTPGRHPDGGGLYLTVDVSGSKRWVFLFTQHGKSREMGLGPVSKVTLEQARSLAVAQREHIGAGRDPIIERDVAKAAGRKPLTFGEAADALIEAKRSGWRNSKHASQWAMTLTEYCKPIRSKAVRDIATEDVLSVLKPIWNVKAETASRVRGRIEAVIDYARALGEIAANEANPARWRGHLDKLLAKRLTLTRGHHAAMPFKDVPAFIASLRGRKATAAIATEFLILTAARSAEVYGAVWSEIDLQARVWTIPGKRMKGGREHRVPLCDRAVAILTQLNPVNTGLFVFAGHRPGKPLSGMSMDMLLRRMDVDCTVHGMRSAFRDWAGETTSFPREVAEAALAHVTGDATEMAYRRGDALEKRRELMAAWGKYCEPSKPSNVVPMARPA